MVRERPVGVKLIPALFFLEGTALIIAAGIGLSRPEFQSAATGFIAQRLPLIKELSNYRLSLLLAPLFALVSLAEGLGVWYLKRGARAFIVYDLTYRLGAGAVAAALLWGMNRMMLLSILSTPQSAIGLATNVLMLGYLLDPDTKRAFGVPDHESD